MAREGTEGPRSGTRAELSPDWAFVVHFRPGTLGEGRAAGGRVEHVASGRTAHFHTMAELAAFAARVLGDLEGAAGPSPEEGGER